MLKTISKTLTFLLIAHQALFQQNILQLQGIGNASNVMAIATQELFNNIIKTNGKLFLLHHVPANENSNEKFIFLIDAQNRNQYAGIILNKDTQASNKVDTFVSSFNIKKVLDLLEINQNDINPQGTAFNYANSTATCNCILPALAQQPLIRTQPVQVQPVQAQPIQIQPVQIQPVQPQPQTFVPQATTQIQLPQPAPQIFIIRQPIQPVTPQNQTIQFTPVPQTEVIRPTALQPANLVVQIHPGTQIDYLPKDRTFTYRNIEYNCDEFRFPSQNESSLYTSVDNRSRINFDFLNLEMQQILIEFRKKCQKTEIVPQQIEPGQKDIDNTQLRDLLQRTNQDLQRQPTIDDLTRIPQTATNSTIIVDTQQPQLAAATLTINAQVQPQNVPQQTIQTRPTQQQPVTITTIQQPVQPVQTTTITRPAQQQQTTTTVIQQPVQPVQTTTITRPAQQQQTTTTVIQQPVQPVQTTTITRPAQQQQTTTTVIQQPVQPVQTTTITRPAQQQTTTTTLIQQPTQPVQTTTVTRPQQQQTITTTQQPVQQQTTQQTTTTVQQPAQQTTTTIQQPAQQTTTTIQQPAQQQTTTTVQQPAQQTTTTVQQPAQQQTTTIQQPAQQQTTTTVTRPVQQQTTTVQQPAQQTTTTIQQPAQQQTTTTVQQPAQQQTTTTVQQPVQQQTTTTTVQQPAQQQTTTQTSGSQTSQQTRTTQTLTTVQPVDIDLSLANFDAFLNALSQNQNALNLLDLSGLSGQRPTSPLANFNEQELLTTAQPTTTTTTTVVTRSNEVPLTQQNVATFQGLGSGIETSQQSSQGGQGSGITVTQGTGEQNFEQLLQGGQTSTRTITNQSTNQQILSNISDVNSAAAQGDNVRVESSLENIRNIVQ